MAAPLLLRGDCRKVLARFPAGSIDAIVTDPPYGLGAEPDPLELLRRWLTGEAARVSGGGFMGKSWDAFVPGPETWRECFRVLKPGGHLLTFGGPRTYDWVTLGLRLARFEIRDSLHWVYGTGFPKSLDVSKAIDAALGVEPSGYRPNPAERSGNGADAMTSTGWAKPSRPPKPIATGEEARRWEGYGTALKPSHEPIILARKPLIGTVARNVLTHGTGALDINGCRIAPVAGEMVSTPQSNPRSRAGVVGTDLGISGATMEDFQQAQRESIERTNTLGRWPSNLLFSHLPECAEGMICAEGCPVAELDGQSGMLKSGAMNPATLRASRPGQEIFQAPTGTIAAAQIPASIGGASRFFPCFRYVAKPSRSERDRGCELLPARTPGEATDRTDGSAGLNSPRAGAGRTGGSKNFHPTVKPIELMRWLVRLITPPGGVVLDPFLGSGPTGIAAVLEDRRFVGVELDLADDGSSTGYLEIARARIGRAIEDAAAAAGEKKR